MSNQLKLPPITTERLTDSWYVQTEPVIALNVAEGTGSVPLDPVAGKMLGGRWNFDVEATVHLEWTSPSADYKFSLNLGYLFPSPLAGP